MAVKECPHPLEIGIEPSLVYVVCMAYIVPNHRFFTAYLAFLGHHYSPSKQKIKTNLNKNLNKNKDKKV
jgi:hypothetical protein